MKLKNHKNNKKMNKIRMNKMHSNKMKMKTNNNKINNNNNSNHTNREIQMNKMEQSNSMDNLRFKYQHFKYQIFRNKKYGLTFLLRKISHLMIPLKWSISPSLNQTQLVFSNCRNTKFRIWMTFTSIFLYGRIGKTIVTKIMKMIIQDRFTLI